MKYFFFILFIGLIGCERHQNRPIVKEQVELSAEQKNEIQNLVVKRSTYNDSLVFYLDFAQSSKRKRFYVYDLKQDSILYRGMVAHGSCNKAPKGTEYSNEEGSHCSSLGLYSIGASYYGKFGLAYKLHGLDSSNSNAFSRFVVLHAHRCVPDSQVPFRICESWGCPTVSPNFLKTLAGLIDQSEKPILLYIEDKDAKS